MVREIVTINVGQCGIQLGDAVWKQYCGEHNISNHGIKKTDTLSNNAFLSFFDETKSGEYVSRQIMIDLEPEIINNIKKSKYSSIYNNEYLLNSQENASYNFNRGHYTVGKEMIDKFQDKLRKLIDKNCDNFHGFIINHSVGGGTGSGLGSLILERCSVDYRKKYKIGFEVYPFNNNKSECIIEPYNAILATHWLLDHTDISFIFDNRKIYNLCKDYLNINLPNYNNINYVIAKIQSCFTSHLRFESVTNFDLSEYQAAMVPFPRLHFINSSISPFINDININKIYIKPKTSKILVDGFIRRYYNQNVNISLLQYEPPLYYDIMNIIYQNYSNKYRNCMKKYYNLKYQKDLCEMCTNNDYFMIESNDFDAEKDEYMSILLNCRGNKSNKSNNANYNTIIKQLENDQHIKFSPWVGRKLTIQKVNENICNNISRDDALLFNDTSVCMFGNNTMISRFFDERITKLFDKMYYQRAFVHWYVGEGMSEGEFAESREDIGFLEKDYLDIATVYPVI